MVFSEQRDDPLSLALADSSLTLDTTYFTKTRTRFAKWEHDDDDDEDDDRTVPIQLNYHQNYQILIHQL